MSRVNILKLDEEINEGTLASHRVHAFTYYACNHTCEVGEPSSCARPALVLQNFHFARLGGRYPYKSGLSRKSYEAKMPLLGAVPHIVPLARALVHIYSRCQALGAALTRGTVGSDYHHGYLSVSDHLIMILYHLSQLYQIFAQRSQFSDFPVPERNSMCLPRKTCGGQSCVGQR